jgi:hypothetical protein
MCISAFLHHAVPCCGMMTKSCCDVLCCALQLLEAGSLERLLSNPTSIKEAIVFAAATGACDSNSHIE